MYLDWLEAPKGVKKRRLFYFTSPDHLLSNLRNRRIKASEFSKCNDIFELASFDLRNRVVRERHKNWISACNNGWGLVCLSDDWRNQLMWGHYAKSGTGACLVIDVDPSNLKKVSYISEREEVSPDFIFPDPAERGKFFGACSKKSTQWGYEREYRFFVDFADRNVVHEDGRRFIKFNDLFNIVGVINGPSPLLAKGEIFSSLGSDVEYFQCRPSFKDFRMVVQQSRSLWKV